MKQVQITENDFYAQDIFPNWKKLIKKSKISVIIYSPYVNEALNELLDFANPGVRIEIYTRLDEDTLCGNIKALIVAISQNARVFHLPGLHAKILLIDNKFVSIGSQNFTYGGQKNKEVSFISKFSFAGSAFLNELKKWNTSSKKISASFLKELHERIIEDCKEFRESSSKLRRRIEEIEEKNKKDVKEAVTKVLANLTHYGTNKYLECRRSQNLLKWEKKNTTLNKGEFYPIMNLDTKQIIFARVNKTRVSFVDNRKECKNVVIGNKFFHVLIVLPKRNYENGNIRISLKGDLGEKIKLKYFFDGKSFQLIIDENRGPQTRQKVIEELNFNHDLLYSLFESFRPNVIVGKEHIVDNFAPDEKYETKIKIKKGIGFFMIETNRNK